ncbi:hypothetical protein P5673_026963 [Acropora cervicornis]|uniref:Reverse transcriptase n=1 Tax=Acropora cervicornis TaxID=6130 RepID=A0AAD9PZH7_ACRCE|nr:hypothetical protein P5673_026963 [Acropora cervicornis]
MPIVSFKPISQANAVNTIEKCIADVLNWMLSNRLFINDSKTEFMIIDSRKQLAEISVDSVTVGDAMIKPGTSLRNLGAWFDRHMTMSVNIGKMSSKAFYSLYNLRQIGKCWTDEACKTLVHALVTYHLDYRNASLHDVSQY